MKTIVAAIFFSLMAVSAADAGQVGQCNSQLGRMMGVSHGVEQGFEKCGELGMILGDFIALGCFDLLLSGDLFTSKNSLNGSDADEPVVAICSALECCPDIVAGDVCAGFIDPERCPEAAVPGPEPGQIGQCNSHLGRLVGVSHRIEQGFEECTELGIIAGEFVNLGCFDLLDAGLLFTSKIGANGSDSNEPVIALCSSLDCCPNTGPPGGCAGLIEAERCPFQ